jgi:hypothetical protein
MKILSKKQTEALFDDLMTLHLIASESIKDHMLNEKPDVKSLLRQHRIIMERVANAAYTLKGMFGMREAYYIRKAYDEKRLKQLEEEEAKKDSLDNEKPNTETA